ncbi:hypothetical protein [Sphingomonas oligophenolica]|uniref:Nucleotidyltransferase family protein n=1 Tax=Sphingomonas oligophenolica TaxID=301154 RepID=A0A502CHQ6_9SPHN|nr:hypothetical protein [Sphingomonas oligophenolica]TPG12343.1 hypothetical protein EAH84_09235 [Sphingomonas oligophenolica]
MTSSYASGPTPALVAACAKLASAMAGAHDRWWIIGSAAVALHGADAGNVRDVYVLLSRRDAEVICAKHVIPIEPHTPHPLFRSAVFARWTGMPLTIELMADLEVAASAGWQRLAPATRQQFTTAAGSIYVPDRQELAAILRRFGREKDIVRAAALDRA